MGESTNKTGVVFSIVSSVGLLLSKIAYILEINKNNDGSIKAEEVETFLHELGYDIQDSDLQNISDIIKDVISTAEKFEQIINDFLIAVNWEGSTADILDFNISYNIIGTGINIFETSKELVENIIALKDNIVAFDEYESINFLNNENLGRRVGDHLVISMFRSIDNGQVFDIPDLPDDKKQKLQKTAFVKSVKIILAVFDLFEIFDTQEINVLYQDKTERTNDLIALNQELEEGETPLKEITSVINIVHWGRFVDVFSFQWGYLKDIYPMKNRTAKLLFKRISKLIEAIGDNELFDLLNVNGILKWLKLLIGGNDDASGTKRHKTLGASTKDEVIELIKDYEKKYNSLDPSLVEYTNSLQIKPFTFNKVSTISITSQDFNEYILDPTKKVLKREGVKREIKNLKNAIEDAGEDIIKLFNERLESVRDKKLAEWFKFVQRIYLEQKINTSDFLKAIEDVTDIIIDDIVNIDKFKKIILKSIQDVLNTIHDYDQKRIKQISVAIALEISSTFIRRFILPKLEEALAKLGTFIRKSLTLALNINECYSELNDNYKALKDLVRAFNDIEKSWKEKAEAAVAFIEEIISQLPKPLKNELQTKIKILKAIYEQFDNTLLHQAMMIADIYNYLPAKTRAPSDSPVSIKLCTQLIEKDNRTAINIYPIIEGKFNINLPLGNSHTLWAILEGDLNTENNNESTPVGFQISENDISLTGKNNTNAKAIFKFTRNQQPWQILNHKYIKIEIKDYPQTLAFIYDNKFEAKYTAELKDASVTLTKDFFKRDDVWSIVGQLISSDIVASFDTTLSYSTEDGFSFAGYPKLKAEFDVSKSFSGLKVDGLNLELGTKFGNIPSRDLSFKTSVSTNLGFNIAGVSFTVSNIGIKLDTPILREGKLSDWDLSVGVQHPNGIGLTIDTPVVKGGGFIQYDEEENKFLGVFDINIVEIIELGILTILNLDVEDVPGNFSFVGLMMLSGCSIPLGFNFYLTGAGGALGLHRMIDHKRVQAGVSDGTLETVFFAKDLQKNINKIEKVAEQYFPIKKNQFFLGLMAKIDFNIPAIMTGEAGLFFQFPRPVEVIVIGDLHIVMPEYMPSVKLNVFFAGGINFEESFWFDASIRDSIIGKRDVFGDISMRVLWGKSTGVLVAAGGTHPDFNMPAKYNMPTNMKRLSSRIDKKVFQFTMGTYFAVGTNTVQFGAKLDLKASVKVAKLRGYLSFDTLFIFNPFRFEAAIKAGVALSAHGVNLLAVLLTFDFSGTQPWRVKGKASAKILLWKVSVGFDKSWGEKAIEIEPEVTPLLPIFTEAWGNPKNWKTLGADNNDKMVILLDSPDKDNLTVIHPLQGFVFEQDKIPLNQPLDSYGKTLPADYKCFKLNPNNVNIGKDDEGQDNIKRSVEQALFIPANFIQMSNEDKLAAPSFVDMDSGFTYQSTQVEHGTEQTEKIEYDPQQDIVTLSNGTFRIKADDDAEEKVITKEYIQDLIDDNSTPFGGRYKSYHSAHTKRHKSKPLRNTNTTDDIKEFFTTKYNLYNKAKGVFVKKKGSSVKISGSYAQIVSQKNQILKEHHAERRSTDLVIMVE